MKLAISYTIERTDYRLIINVEESNIHEELNKMLKELCEKFDGKVERYRVSKIMEELHTYMVPPTTNMTLHLSDNSNFIIKPVLESVTDGSLRSFSKEERIIDVRNPCH